uniref:Uncharacterized protein n=1 Tax=Arundo donax TaxID=35708 RepID=A0A0A9BHS8_ARUDO
MPRAGQNVLGYFQERVRPKFGLLAYKVGHQPPKTQKIHALPRSQHRTAASAWL